jgi:hypothetical protein
MPRVRDETEQIKAALKAKKKAAPIPADAFLSTGSTVLNMALSGRPNGGLFKGCYCFLVGDSATLKTILSLTCMAEASINPNFEGYRFVHDNVENGSLMDMEKFFGAKLVSRIEPPAGTRAKPVYSGSLEEFYYHLDKAMDKGPCVYVLDSMDVLETEEDDKVFEGRKAKFLGTSKGKDKNTFGVSKAKANSRMMPRIIRHLAETGSILIIITQTRDKIGFGTMPGQKTRGGGHALKFYAHLELWTSVAETIRTPSKVKGKVRKLGKRIKVKVEKNRVSGWEGEVIVPVYRSVGIDDLGGCVEYLLAEGHWKKPKGKGEDAEEDDGEDEEEERKGAVKKVVAPEYDYEGTVDGLVKKVEEEDLEADLRDLVSDVWREIDRSLLVQRKSRYAV